MIPDTITHFAYQLMFWTEMMTALGYAVVGVEDVSAGAAENGGHGYYPDGRLKFHSWDDPVRLHYVEVV